MIFKVISGLLIHDWCCGSLRICMWLIGTILTRLLSLQEWFLLGIGNVTGKCCFSSDFSYGRGNVTVTCCFWSGFGYGRGDVTGKCCFWSDFGYGRGNVTGKYCFWSDFGYGRGNLTKKCWCLEWFRDCWFMIDIVVLWFWGITICTRLIGVNFTWILILPEWFRFWWRQLNRKVLFVEVISVMKDAI